MKHAVSERCVVYYQHARHTFYLFTIHGRGYISLQQSRLLGPTERTENQHTCARKPPKGQKALNRPYRVSLGRRYLLQR